MAERGPTGVPHSVRQNGTATCGHLTMGVHYSRLLMTTINIGAEQCMWGKKKRARSNALELAYVQRLQEIDVLSAAHDDLGPSEWNMGLGQSEFWGEPKAVIFRIDTSSLKLKIFRLLASSVKNLMTGSTSLRKRCCNKSPGSG